MTFPTTPILDDFNRADEGPPPGPIWSSFTFDHGGPAFTWHPAGVTNGRLDRKLDEASNPSLFISCYVTSEFGPNQEAYITIGPHDVATKHQMYIDFFMKFQPTTFPDLAPYPIDSGYVVNFFRDNLDDELGLQVYIDIYRVYKIGVSFLSETIYSGVGVDFDTGDVIGARVNGDTITAFKNGIEVASGANSALSGVSGHIGLMAFGWNQSFQELNDTYDDFGGGEMPTPETPVADFSADVTSGQTPLTVNFTDLSTNTPTSWAWDFGDGGTSTDQNPTHIYSTVGIYTVTLTATNVAGSDPETKVDYITAGIVTADFSGTPLSGTEPLTVSFTDLSAGPPDTWLWDFGDGESSTVQNPVHVYSTSGSYTVSLTASNSVSSGDEIKSLYITVSSADPTNLQAIAVAYNEIDLRWVDNSSDEDGFSIERSADGLTGWTEIGTVSTDEVTYEDTSVSGNETWYYRVRGFKGVSFPTTPILDDFNRPDEGPPPSTDWVNGFFYTPAWQNDPLYKLRVLNDECVNSGSEAGAGGVYHADTYGPNIEVYFEVGDFDSGGGNYVVYWSLQDPDVNDNYYSILFPCTVHDPGDGPRVEIGILFWKRISGVQSGTTTFHPGVDIYPGDWLGARHSGGTISVYYKPTGGVWSFIMSSPETNILSPGYLAVEFYGNIAVSPEKIDNLGGGNFSPSYVYSGYTNIANATTPDAPPADPTLLIATAVSAHEIDLSWTDNASNEDGFIVERSPNGTDTWTVIGGSAADVTTFDDIGLPSGTTFYYRVYAFNGQGNSGYSNIANATTFKIIPRVRHLSLVGSYGIGLYVEGEAYGLDSFIDDLTTDLSIAALATLYAHGIVYNTVDIDGTIVALAGDRAAYDALNYPTRHTDDTDNPSGIHHTLSALDAMFLTPAEHSAIGYAYPHHDPISLNADADTLLGLSVQQLTLDTQAANKVFAGPATGSPAVPTFRTLTTSDVPAVTHNILSATHSDSTAASVVRGDLVVGIGASPTWQRYGLVVPAAGTLNYFGVNNGEVEPTYKSASSNPGVAAAILQTTTAGALTLSGMLTATGFITSTVTNDQEVTPSVNITQSATVLEDGSGHTGADETLDNLYEAVKFTASANDNVRYVSIWLKRSGTITSTNTLQFRIYNDNAGVPGTIRATTTPLTHNVLTTSYVEYVAPVSTTLVAGTVYWIAVSYGVAPTGGGTILAQRDSTGTAMHAISTDGSAWTTEDNKTLRYRIYGRVGYGISSVSNYSRGVYGKGGVGVYGETDQYTGYGIYGINNGGGNGIFGASSVGIGVNGSSTGGPGVSGTSTSGVGVSGTSGSSTGITASSVSGDALQARNNGAGSAIYLYGNGASTNGLLYAVGYAAGAYVIANLVHAGTGKFIQCLKYTGSVEVFSVANSGLTTVTGQTTTANATMEVLRLQSNVSTAATGGASGFGPSLTFYGESATDGNYRQMAQLDATWATATDATRKARLTSTVYDTAAREGMRIEASGSAPLIGFLGAAAIARYSSTGDLRQCLIDFGLYTTGGASPLDLNGGLLTAGSAKIGSATNYANFSATGVLTLVGTARVLKEVQIPTTSATHGGAAPTNAQRAVGASGSVLLDVDQFSKTSQNDVYFDFHAPNDVDNAVNISFHVVWLPGAGWTTGNYLWKLEYLVKSNGDAYNTGTPTTIQADVTPANATAIIETAFATTINLDRDQMLMCHFYRDVAGDNADDTGDTLFFEFEYTSDRLGE